MRAQPEVDIGPVLVRRLGAAAVADAASCRAFSIGGMVPSAVVRPADGVELAAGVAAVGEAGGALVPIGLGAHRALGHGPARYDVALVTDGLARLRDYTPADMTITVEAGVTVSALADALAREGQWLPIEPPHPARTTVGGMLAADLAGTLAASQGRVRDYVIGIGTVTAAGTPTRAGGRVVKNVAGYDLMKLFIGSLGTLAVLTEATFKVRPLPEQQHGLVFRVRDLSAALALGAEIDGVLAVWASGALGERANKATVTVRLGGVAADVAAARARLGDLAGRHGAEIALDADASDATVAAVFASARDFSASAECDLVLRLAMLPSRLAAVAQAAAAHVPSAAALADPRRGVLTLAVASGDPQEAVTMIAALAQVADGHGAHLVVERHPDALAPTIAVWHPLPAALPLMRRMKAALDPAGVLAPGRFVGRI